MLNKTTLQELHQELVTKFKKQSRIYCVIVAIQANHHTIMLYKTHKNYHQHTKKCLQNILENSRRN